MCEVSRRGYAEAPKALSSIVEFSMSPQMACIHPAPSMMIALHNDLIVFVYIHGLNTVEHSRKRKQVKQCTRMRSQAKAREAKQMPVRAS